MTPAARVQASIEILDEILAGSPAERALTGWARRSRFAGSKDRAAVRDHVYDVLRQRNSCMAVGRGSDGRALMIGLMALQGADIEEVFSGQAYAPSALDLDEAPDLGAAIQIDLPDWAIEEMRTTLGDDFAEVERLLKARAPVILRVNLRKSNRDTAATALERDGILTQTHHASDTALTVTEGARKVAQSQAYLSGLIELQDASSQAAIQALPLKDSMRVLDYCAGGGGKLLAMAGRVSGAFYAHDAHEQRMRDLPKRAKRAGIKPQLLKTAQLAQQAPFDLVFCDVPCSGSGSWRRDPDGKWRMSEVDFRDLLKLQSEILTKASGLVKPGGCLVYATCSLCASENRAQVRDFLTSHPDWACEAETQWTPLDGCDGFFSAVLRKPS